MLVLGTYFLRTTLFLIGGRKPKGTSAMLLKLGVTVIAGMLMPINAPTSPLPDHVYVEVIVKACPPAEIIGTEDKPDAVMGYYADPINQGTSYDNESPPTRS